MLTAVREKSILFWTLAFPIILSTLFFFAFGNSPTQSVAPATDAYVVVETESEANQQFVNFLENLDLENFSYTLGTLEEATAAITDGKVNGIFILNNEITLQVLNADIGASILMSLLDSYTKAYEVVKDIATTHPEGVQAAIESLRTQTMTTKEASLGGDPSKSNNQYFYALLAMACMYGSFLGLDTIIRIQANQSTLGARRSVTATPRGKLILAEMIACFILAYICTGIILTYMHFALGIAYGNSLPHVLLNCLAGSAIGVSFGIMVASFGKKKEGAKVGILIGISMLLSFFAGLMSSSMKSIVEHNFPLLNRVNPAALITELFYYNAIFDNPEHYWRAFSTLAIEIIIFLSIAFIAIRREKYDSI